MQRANIDLDVSGQGGVAEYVGEARGPFDRLVERLHPHNAVAGNQLVRPREGPLGHGALASRKVEAYACRTWLKSLGCEKHAGLEAFRNEGPHCGDEFL